MIKRYFIKDVAFFKLSILVGSHTYTGCRMFTRNSTVSNFVVIEESLELGIEIVSIVYIYLFMYVFKKRTLIYKLLPTSHFSNDLKQFNF